MNNPTDDKLLDDILDMVTSFDVTKHPEHISEAKQAILQWVNDEVIGKDYNVERPASFVAGEYAVRVGANYEKSQERNILKQHGWKGE